MISNTYITNNSQIRCMLRSHISADFNRNDAYESRIINYAEIYA